MGAPTFAISAGRVDTSAAMIGPIGNISRCSAPPAATRRRSRSSRAWTGRSTARTVSAPSAPTDQAPRHDTGRCPGFRCPAPREGATFRHSAATALLRSVRRRRRPGSAHITCLIAATALDAEIRGLGDRGVAHTRGHSSICRKLGVGRAGTSGPRGQVPCRDPSRHLLRSTGHRLLLAPMTMAPRAVLPASASTPAGRPTTRAIGTGVRTFRGLGASRSRATRPHSPGGCISKRDGRSPTRSGSRRRSTLSAPRRMRNSSRHDWYR